MRPRRPRPLRRSAPPGNPWAAQAVWINQIADEVAAELVSRWGDTIGAIDTTFTRDTVAAAVTSISTDASSHMP